MRVVGIGIDLVALERIEDLLARHRTRFVERCFRIDDFPLDGQGLSVACRWAAKEAFLKALGAEVRNIPYRDIEVAGEFPGPGRLVLHGRAREALAGAGGKRVHLTTGQVGDFVLASVVIEE